MSDLTVSFSNDDIDWEELADIYRKAPLGTHKPENLKQAYLNSNVCCFISSHNSLIGAGRAISDGVYFATICDIVVHPEWQGQGIGRTVLETMIEKLSVPKILLACVIGQEGFYRKAGFLRHKSVMAKYPNVEWFQKNGYLE